MPLLWTHCLLVWAPYFSRKFGKLSPPFAELKLKGLRSLPAGVGCVQHDVPSAWTHPTPHGAHHRLNLDSSFTSKKKIFHTHLGTAKNQPAPLRVPVGLVDFCQANHVLRKAFMRTITSDCSWCQADDSTQRGTNQLGLASARSWPLYNLASKSEEADLGLNLATVTGPMRNLNGRHHDDGEIDQ